MKNIKALSLFSGGLDSILATRVVMEQNIEVEAIQFVTPFFNYDILDDIEAHKLQMQAQYGINVEVEDISVGYLQLLHNPSHGFGKNFNPCIDCKIMMFTRAKELLAEKGASFLISGRSPWAAAYVTTPRYHECLLSVIPELNPFSFVLSVPN